MNNWDSRAWIGLSVFVLVVAVFALTAWNPQLRADEFFKTISALIVGAFIKDVVGWAFGATKQGDDIVAKKDDTQRVVVENDKANPVPTTRDDEDDEVDLAP